MAISRRPAKEVPEAEWGNYMWIADRELLSAWLDLHNLYKLKDRVLEKGARQ
jgi:hypothetical protein